MKIVFKTIVLATAVLLLVVIATIDSATITLTEEEPRSESRRLRHRRVGVVAARSLPPTTSSVDLYNAMELAEQERGLSGDDGDDSDDSENSGGSLLSLMPGGSQRQQPSQLLRCASCSGSLPRDATDDEAIDEQSYCLPDRSSSGAHGRRRRRRSKRRRREDNNNGTVEEDREDDRQTEGLCFGAVRCWKAKVREQDGLVRVSRGCVVSEGQGSPYITPCMGAVPVVGVNGSAVHNDGDSAVWTSHAYYSASAGYAIECCAGRDRCNEGGSFPTLSRGDQSGDEDDAALQPSMAWWRQRWSWSLLPVLVVVAGAATTAAFVAARLFRKKRRRKRTDGKKRRRRRSNGKRRRRNVGGGRGKRGQSADSDSSGCDADAKKRRANSSESDSDSSASSSESAALSSASSCCGEAKKSRRQRHRRRRSRSRKNGGALTMVDLLKGVVVTNGGKGSLADDTYDGNRPQPNRYTEYSATAETTIDGCSGSSPPPYQPRERDPHRRRGDRGNEDDEGSGGNRHHQPADSDDWTSGSGYGMPVLVQRTLAKQLQLRQLVGKGRYGEVWRATYWNGGHEHVAVKIFLSKDEPSWKRETEIYSTVLMRHEHILGFIGSDIMTSRNSYTTQLLLITHYYRHGSLYDFLQTSSPMTITGTQQQGRPPLTVGQMLNVLYTVASGLCHLHTEIHGKQGKPGIAHRDIKSKNVLVKCAVTGACCVADFGMAVTSQDATIPSGQQQTVVGAGGAAANNARVGTKRYMAPEVLDDSISSAAGLASASTTATTTISAANYNNNTTATAAAANSSTAAYWCFDAYRRGDVYSYALVMWEVLSRTLIPEEADTAASQLPLQLDPQQQLDAVQKPHQPATIEQQQQLSNNNGYNPYVYRAPYQDRAVGWDPGFDDMRRVVCSTDPVLSRPGIATEWLADPIIHAVVAVMRECWHGNPNVRLPMLRVKKTLSKLINQYAAKSEGKNEETGSKLS